MKIEKEIGKGCEAVYIYYNENDKKLALLENRDRWECKIGFSAGNPIDRILYTCPQEIRATLPTIGLIIYTDYGYYTESKIHQAFSQYRMNFSRDGYLGDEWFMTNPLEVENYFLNNMLPDENNINHLYEYEIDSVNDLMLMMDSHRKTLKLRQSDIAEEVGINRITVHKALSKKTGKMSLNVFFSILKVLNLRCIIRSYDR